MKTAHRHSRHNHRIHDIYADLQKIKDAVTDTAFDVREKTGELFNESVDGIKERSTRLRDNLMDYTAEKPVKSLGIALVVGLVLGFLLRK